MLPMHFRPDTQGEVVPRDHEIVLPPSAQTKVWQQAARMALDVIGMALRRFG